MVWSWNPVAHIILLQVALAFYYLIWPALSKGLIWLLRRVSKFLPQSEAKMDAECTRSRPYRGAWRDTQYQHAERSDRAQWQDHKRRQAERACAAGTLKSKHLSVLGLSEPVHLIDIKTAYRALAMTYHPDRYASDEHSATARANAAEKMRVVNEAYDWLRTNA